MELQRNDVSEKWGLLWDGKAFTKGQRIIQDILPNSLAARCNEGRLACGQPLLEKGDELIQLNGKRDAASFSELTSLLFARLVFVRQMPLPVTVASLPTNNIRTEESFVAELQPESPTVSAVGLAQRLSALSIDCLPQYDETGNFAEPTFRAPQSPTRAEFMPRVDMSTRESACSKSFDDVPKAPESWSKFQAPEREAQMFGDSFGLHQFADKHSSQGPPAMELNQVRVEQQTQNFPAESSVGTAEVRPILSKPTAEELSKLAQLLSQGEAGLGSALELVQPLLRKPAASGLESDSETVSTSEAVRFLLEVMAVMEMNSQVDSSPPC